MKGHAFRPSVEDCRLESRTVLSRLGAVAATEPTQAQAALALGGNTLPCNGQGISTSDILQIMGTPIRPRYHGNLRDYINRSVAYSNEVLQQYANAVALADFLNSPEAKQDGLVTSQEVGAFLGEVRAETTDSRFGAGLTSLTEAAPAANLAPYQGRGDLQLTHGYNYVAASVALFGDTRLATAPGLVSSDPTIAARTAGWYWKQNNLSFLADAGDVDAISVAILGQGSRNKLFFKYLTTRFQRENFAANATTILANCTGDMTTQTTPPTQQYTLDGDEPYAGGPDSDGDSDASTS